MASNYHCARETVDNIMEDFISGRLRRPHGDRPSLQQLLAARQPDLISGDGWHAIDQAERRRGNASGRPRAKFTDRAKMVEIARSP
jgi:ferredoxin--NADP+ reductase